MHYNSLLSEFPEVKVKELELQYGFKGLYRNGVILIDKRMNTVKKGCVLGEELGHHFTTVGNILDQSSINNRKQEKMARKWAHKKILPISCFIDAYKYGCRNRFEIAEFLDVTEDFLQEALDFYIEKHGTYIKHQNLIILLDPLNILEAGDK